MGKNVEIRKLLPGKCDHLVGNFVFFNKEIHKKCNYLPGKNTFFSRPAGWAVGRLNLHVGAYWKGKLIHWVDKCPSS